MTKPSELHRRFRALPLAARESITAGGTIFILAPHPDDESLGCGGLIAASCEAGTPPIVGILTDGTGSHPGSRDYDPARRRALREQEACEAAACLGLARERVVFLRLPDTAAPQAGPDFDAAVTSVETLLRQYDCAAIGAPWRHDPHGDHVAAHNIAVAAAARARIPLASYLVWGWTLHDDIELPEANVVGVRLDISKHLDRKRAAIAAHASQHGRVILDDPGGFTLPAELLRIFEVPYEVYLGVTP